MHFPHIILFATEQAAAQASGQPSFVGTLGLNWKLFLAQLVNFGIVLFILWKWVFSPVTRALESRRQKIEDSVKKAEEIEKRMKESESERDNILKAARSEAEKINQRAVDAADSAKKEIVENARKESERILQDAEKAIEAERETVLKEVRQEIAHLIILSTEKIIKQKLDSKQDRELVDEVLQQVK